MILRQPALRRDGDQALVVVPTCVNYRERSMPVWSQLRRWMSALPFTDSLRREQAATLQSLILVLIIASLIGVPLSLSATSQIDRLVGIVSSVVQALLLILAAVLLRRGQFSTAVALVIVSTILFAALNMIPTGLEGSRAVFTVLAIPIVLAGLLGGRRLLVFASALTMILVIGVAVFSSLTPSLVGYSQQTYDPRLTSGVYVVVALVLTVLIDRFGRALHMALSQARSRERELEALHMSLEQQISERTAILQATVDQLSASQRTITLLGAPILPVLPGVLVAPLIGLFDSARAAALSEKILTAIASQRAETVIFDITGVAAADQRTIAELLQLAGAVRLLGAEPVIVGVRPEVAIALVEQEIDLRAQHFYPNLQEAVQVLRTQSTA
jgi:rsbT co-antagonist protein RsbR